MKEQEHHKPQKITMKSIADLLGISPSAVFLALKDLPGVSSITRTKVKHLAKKLNYRPDPAVTAASSIRWGSGSHERHSVIAFLSFNNPISEIQQTSFFNSASVRANEMGYRLDPFIVDHYAEAKILSRVLHSRGIQGLLIAPIPVNTGSVFSSLDWDHFTSVSCGPGRCPLPIHTVTDNVFINTRLAWEKAINAGFKKIGAVLHFHDPIDEDDWHRMGASFASRELLEISDAHFVPPMLAAFNDDDALYNWYCKHRPEIVIGFNNFTADKLIRRGVRFPQDSAFISLSTVQNSPWSGIVRPFDLIAQVSVEILADELRSFHRGKPSLARTTCIQPQWNVGTSFSNQAPPQKNFINHCLNEIGT